MAALRPRAPRPTTCPASSCSPRPGKTGPAAGLGPAVVGRLPAQQVPGHPVPVARATPSTTSATPTASARARSGRSSRRSTGSTACSPRTGSTPRSQTRIAQYEMAFRMQTSRARADRLRRASRKQMLDLYGVKQPGDGSFASQLPAGPPAGRARRPVHPALPPRLGPPRRHRAGHADRPPRTSTRPAPRWSRT